MDDNKLNILNRLLGWGNPKSAKIAFIGYEPGSNFFNDNDSEENQFRIADKRNSFYTKLIKKGEYFVSKELWPEEWDLNSEVFERKRTMGITENIQAYFSYQFRKRILLETIGVPYDSFWKDEFCKSIEIQTNLYPIFKKSEKEGYSNLTLNYFRAGSTQEIYGFFNSHREERLDIMKDVFDSMKNNDAIFIFMGTPRDSREGIFEKLFPERILEDEIVISNLNYKRKRYARWSSDRNVVFLPHPRKGMVYKTRCRYSY